jgi:UMF1 family MFS transporter
MSIKKNDPKIIKAWTYYDWANSVFPLVITSAIFPNYYEYVTSHDTSGASDVFIGDSITLFGNTFHNQDIYSYVYSFALFIVVLIIPILSGIADYFGNKKRFLQFFCYLGAFSCMGLYFFDRHYIGLSFLPFITATIGFWGSLVFYNSYLPEIASEDQQDKVSAKGYARGYFGSSLLLILCLIGIIVFKYDKTTGEGFFKVKYSFLLTGCWWIGFAQYTFRHLPNSLHKSKGKANNLFSQGFGELRKVYGKLKDYRDLKTFLGSYFFYNMGVQTVMVMAVLFARKEITWPDEKTKTNSLIISILLIQFLGVAGSYVFSYVSRKLSNLKGLLIAISIWIFICFFTYTTATQPIHFYIVAALVGFVMGGIQALSRSTYSKFLPAGDDHTSWFSFYDVLEKLGMILGTLSFGIISQLTGGMRNSVLALIIFFIIGFLILAYLDRKVSRAK